MAEPAFAYMLDEPLKVINMHEAKTHLSALVDKAVAGEPFVIAKAGKPQVVVYAYANELSRKSLIGFMPNLIVPKDFDTMMTVELTALVSGGEEQ
jgi:prevent-host-death family protein